MNYNSELRTLKKKKRLKKKIRTRKIICVLILISFLTLPTIKFIKMNHSKWEYKKALSTYEDILSSNENLFTENIALENTICEKNSQYDKLHEESLKAQGPIAHLTFDDGPSDHTLQLLDVLDQFNVKATFFVNYKEGYDDVYREIVNRGHTLANHTYSHMYKNIYTSADAFVNDVVTLDNKLEEITGKPASRILRFPGGSNTTYLTKGNNILPEVLSKLSELNYTFYDWNVDSSDASVKTQKKEKIVSGVLNGATLVNTANVLMHDTNMKKTTLDALPEIIKGLKDQGYNFKPLTHDSAAIRFIN